MNDDGQEPADLVGRFCPFATSGAATGTLLSRLWQGEAVPAVEPDEARRRHDPHLPEAASPLLVQDDIFSAPWADGWTRRPPILSWAASGGGT